MKGLGVLGTGTLLFVFSIIAVKCQDSGYNGVCDKDKYCLPNKGLICQDGRCKCGEGKVTKSLEYFMAWDFESDECVAAEHGVCVGTRKNPVASGMRGVRCGKNLVCVQVDDLPLGQGVCKRITTINGQCDQNRHCDSGVGLICEQGKCICGGGPLNHAISFDMEWDQGQGKCMAKLGGACVGTERDSVTGNMKNVECITGECIQIQGLPPGVGVCTSDSETSPTTNEPTSQPTTQPTTESNTGPTTDLTTNPTAPTDPTDPVTDPRPTDPAPADSGASNKFLVSFFVVTLASITMGVA